MTMIPTTPIAFYKGVQSLLLDIRYYENLVNSQNEELESLIKKSGPGAVRAMAYDKIPGSATVYVPDSTILERIDQLAHLLPLNRLILENKKADLRYLRKEGYKTSEKLEDLKLKVFLASYVDGKRNEDIAKELGYSIHTIFHAKVEINRILDLNVS